MKASPSDSQPGHPSWPGEWQLLLCCGQARNTAANEARLDELLAGNLDGKKSWVRPALWACRPCWKRPWRRVILRKHRPKSGRPSAGRPAALHARNLQSVGELFTLADLFAAHGLRVLPFKGPVLAVQAYGGLGLRPFPISTCW